MNTMTETATDDLSELDFIDLERAKLDPAWARTLPASVARRYQAVAVCQIDGRVIVATSHRRVSAVRRLASKHLESSFRLMRADRASVQRILRQLYSQPVDSSDPFDEVESNQTVQICDELLAAAALRDASDIHLVPGDSDLRCSFRVDGILEPYQNFDPELKAGMTSRIKVMAGLDIAEKRKPQDGRFSIPATSSRPQVDVRVATIPTRYGERLTLRLLKPLQGTPSLGELGMGPRELEHFSSAIHSANGLILLTGPTGCGKSTTLYTALAQLMANRGGNIITVEDPIEYEIPGITQVEVDSAEKVTFAGALRSILRHDPDVIMLGEIRDAETAELAIKASLTGHLVFSTLHTNTAAGVVTRLIDMGVEPFLVAATLRMAIAQRLVRKLCPHCRVPSKLSLTQASALDQPGLAGTETYESSGCVYCAGKGFAGRTAVFEMLRGGQAVSDLISEGASESDLQQHMRDSDSCQFVDDGLDKVRQGTTTADQLIRAVATW